MRRSEQTCQLFGFGEQCSNINQGAGDLRVDHSGQPEDRFVRFFGDDPYLRRELRVRTCPARCAIVRRCGGRRVLILTGKASGDGSVRQSFNESKREVSECVGAGL